MNEREWILFKASQLEMLWIIRRAQVTARWVIGVSRGVIYNARQKSITFKPKERK